MHQDPLSDVLIQRMAFAAKALVILAGINVFLWCALLYALVG